jgi:hypothetical protein
LPLTGLKAEQFLVVRTDLGCQQAAKEYQGTQINSLLLSGGVLLSGTSLLPPEKKLIYSI